MAAQQHLNADILQRERNFHNAWAEVEGEVDFEKLARDFSAPLAVERRYIIKQVGNLQGKTILDVGSGLGEASAFFVSQGAKITALDLSDVMLARLRQIFAKKSLPITLVQGDAAVLPFPDNSFDFVYAENVIHHLQEKEKFFTEIKRVLKADGIFCTIDPLAYHPLINVYRRLATKVRSSDEQALCKGDLRPIFTHFSDVKFRFFWFFSLAIFLKFFLIDRFQIFTVTGKKF